jgi:hypothetical protein
VAAETVKGATKQTDKTSAEMQSMAVNLRKMLLIVYTFQKKYLQLR